MQIKALLKILGVIAFLVGLVWMAQGTGYLHIPHADFMYLRPEWTIRGAGLAVAGLVTVLVARWINTRH